MRPGAGFAVLIATALVFSACAQGADEVTTTDAPGTTVPDETTAVPDETTAVPDETTAPPAVTEVTFLTDFFLLNGRYAPFFAGVEQGFFADQGLDVSIELGRGSVDTASQVAAGAADFGIVDTLAGVVAIAEGAPLTFVASLYQKYVGGVCSLSDRLVIEDFSDLEGLRISGPEGDAFIAILPHLTDADFEHVVVEPAAMLSTVLAGDADAVAAAIYSEPERQVQVQAQGFSELACFFYADHGVDILGHGLVVRNDLIESDPAIVQAFVDGYATSLVWALENPDEAIKIFMEVNPEVDDAESARESLVQGSNFYVVPPLPDGQLFLIPEDRLMATVELALRAFDIDTDVTADTVFTNEFAERISEELRSGSLP